MSFKFSYEAQNKGEAKAQAHVEREKAKPNVHHSVVDFIEHAVNGFAEDGPIVVDAAGHMAAIESGEPSELHITVAPAAEKKAKKKD